MAGPTDRTVRLLRVVKPQELRPKTDDTPQKADPATMKLADGGGRNGKWD